MPPIGHVSPVFRCVRKGHSGSRRIGPKAGALDTAGTGAADLGLVVGFVLE